MLDVHLGSMPLIRAFLMLFVAFALLLAVGPGPRAYAAGMDAALSAQQDPDGCDPAMTPHGPTEKHDAGGCGKMSCCLGAVCVSAGLTSAMVVLATPVSATALDLSAVTALLTGRDVAPPLDPPRQFA